VAATDVESGARTSTTISLSSGLSEQDIQRSIENNRATQLASQSDEDEPTATAEPTQIRPQIR
jgi:molecular chaperone DnaK